MIDETASSDQTPLSGNAELAAREEDEIQGSVIRTKVIPAIAGLLMVTIVALILWSMFAPNRRDSRQRGVSQEPSSSMIRSLSTISSWCRSMAESQFRCPIFGEKRSRSTSGRPGASLVSSKYRF